MTHNPPPPKLSLLPEVGAVHARTARLARRLLRRRPWPGRQRHHRAAAARQRGLDGRCGGRRGRRRRALARPDDAACRALEARRRAAVAPAHDGGDGPAGLRPVRLQLSGLRRRDRFQEGSQAQSVHPRRQGHAAHAQGRSMARWARPALRRSCRRRPSRRRRVAQAAPRAGRSRDNPTEAVFVSRTLLNKPGSAKQTWHLEFDLSSSGLDYVVGDCFGIFPTNDPALVAAVITALGASADFPINGRTLREVLTEEVALGLAPDTLFQLYSYITGGERRQKAKALASGEDPDGDAADSRRARRDRKICARAARSGSFRRSARAAAAAAVFHLLVAQEQSRPRRAHGRRGALSNRQTRTPRRRLHLPWRTRGARRRA